MSDYYSILGVQKGASPEEIKKAYRHLAQQYHPDKKGGDEKKFKEINEAYQVLGNQEKREQYDKFGRTFDSQQGFGGGGGFDFGSFWQAGQAGGFNFDEFDLGDIFGDFFGTRHRSPNRKVKNRGEDIEIKVGINLADTLAGVEKTINLDKMIRCGRCQGSGGEPSTSVKECFVCRGTGQVQQIKRTILGTVTRYVTCPDCKGEGKIPEKPCNVCHSEGRIKGEEEINIFIPAGVDTGQIIRISSKGNAGKRGAVAGDLYIKIFVKPHSVFKRKGDDLFVSVPIVFSQAVLGGEIELTTLDGKKISLKVPSGVESGKILRISGKGIPNFGGWGKGDIYVELVIKTPKKLTKKQKELMEKMREEGI